METCLTVLRISDTREDSDNQKVITAPFIAKKGWRNVATVWLDGCKRFDMNKHKYEIFKKVKEHKPDHVVFRDTKRIGFKTKQLIRFISELEDDFGVKTWLAKGERCLNEEGYGLHTTLDESSASVDEIMELSFRVQNGRRRTVKDRGSSPGKIVPYGYDMAYYNRDGKLKYIVILAGWKRCPGEHANGKPNLALHRIKRYPDGRHEDYNDTWQWNEEKGKYELEHNAPAHEKSLRRMEIPNSDRAEVVKDIFRLADTPHWHTPCEIAHILNQKNISPLRGELFDSRTVEGILRNRIYKGRPCDGIHSRAIFRCEEFQHSVEYNLTDEERQRIRLVSEEQWTRVNEHLDGRTKWYKRTRRPNTGDFWSKPFLRCACGQVVYISNQSADRQYYRCKKCGGVRVAVIHDLVDQWLKNLPQAIETANTNIELDRTKEELVEHLGNSLNDNGVVGKMIQYICDYLPDTNKGITDKATAFLDKWTSVFGLSLRTRHLKDYFDRLESFYVMIFNNTNKDALENIAAIQQRLDSLQHELESGNNLQTVLAAVKNLENQKKTLEESLVSLVPEFRRHVELTINLLEAMSKLASDLRHATGEDKAVKLEPYLDRVIIHFDKEGVRNNECKLSRLEVIPTPKGLPGITFDSETCQRVARNYNKNNSPETQAKKSATMKAKWKERNTRRVGGKFATPTLRIA